MITIIRSDNVVTRNAKNLRGITAHGQKLLYFKSNINGKFMLEAPFQFDPFWERRGM